MHLTTSSTIVFRIEMKNFIAPQPMTRTPSLERGNVIHEEQTKIYVKKASKQEAS